MPYVYNIGTKDVTASQYVEFLNAKDTGGANTLFLYNGNMSNPTYGGISFTAGNPSGSKYGVIGTRGDHPANYISWYDAIRFANSTAYGLVAGVWTENGGRAMRMASAIKSGQVFINNYGAGGGVELPFGGVKSSGYGREKGFEALYGFSVLKTVVVKHG